MPKFTDPRSNKRSYLANAHPDITSTKTIESRLISVAFGDGYEQVAGDGLNTDRVIWDLEFGGLSEESANLLVKEATKAQTHVVTYTVFGDTQRVYRVVPGTISQSYNAANACDISFQIREVFGFTPDEVQTMAEAYNL